MLPVISFPHRYPVLPITPSFSIGQDEASAVQLSAMIRISLMRLRHAKFLTWQVLPVFHCTHPRFSDLEDPLLF
jgi:hypothetical protein